MPKIKIYGEQTVSYTFNNYSPESSAQYGPAQDSPAQNDETIRPALVLIHGAGGTHLHWPAELRMLDSTAVYALDLPAHGKSAPPGRTSIEEYADDIAAFVEALGLEHVVLVGHSMGGAIAQTIGLRKPS